MLLCCCLWQQYQNKSEVNQRCELLASAVVDLVWSHLHLGMQLTWARRDMDAAAIAAAVDMDAAAAAAAAAAVMNAAHMANSHYKTQH